MESAQLMNYRNTNLPYRKVCPTAVVNMLVGYHKDTFSNNNGDKIENKILLVLRDRCDTSSKVALGPGGAGPGEGYK
eukprot:7617430-Ditylum_brightwellii.AAC.1